MLTYFVRPLNPYADFNKRTCSYHSAVYHGMAYRNLSRVQFAKKRDRIDASFPDEGVLALTRSGAFVPYVFSPTFTSLVVKSEVAVLLSSVAGIRFAAVDVERLVDAPMPKLGDFSWYEKAERSEQLDPDQEIGSMPDAPSLHAKVGSFLEILSENVYSHQRMGPKVRRIQAHYGTLNGQGPDAVPVSKALLKMHPILWADVFIFREDAFAKLAPYIDLDYYGVARADVQ